MMLLGGAMHVSLSAREGPSVHGMPSQGTVERRRARARNASSVLHDIIKKEELT